MIALSLTALAQTATPPTQPDTVPGSKQYVHAKVTKNRYGTGNQEYWSFEPDTPIPSTAPVVLLRYGCGGMNPLYYGAWLDYSVTRSLMYVSPTYHETLLMPSKDYLPHTI